MIMITDPDPDQTLAVAAPEPYTVEEVRIGNGRVT